MVRRGIELSCALVLVWLLAVGVHAKTLTLMMYGNPDQQYYYDLIKAGFERDNPGYVLEYELVPFGEYIEKVLVNFAAGTSADVFLTWAQFKPQFAEDGVILDLTHYIESSDKMNLEAFFPVIEQNISYDGRYWGAPWGFNSTLWVANADMLNEAGLAVPAHDWSVDDFKGYARKLARPDEQIFAIAASPIGDYSGIQWMQNWAGHKWVDEDGTDVLVNSESAVDMVDFWREIAVEMRAMPSTLTPRADRANFFTSGDAAFAQYFTTVTADLSRLVEQGVHTVNWDFVTYPKAPRGQGHFAQGHLWTIPSNHPNPDEAWKLVEWLGSEQADYVWSSSQRLPPTMPLREHWDLYNRGLPPEQRQKAHDFIINTLYQGEYANNFEYWPTFGPMNSIWNAEIKKVLDGEKSARAAMDEAARTMQVVLDEYRSTNGN